MDDLPKEEYEKLKKLRFRILQINSKRHQLIRERKKRGYSVGLGLKMAKLGEEREEIYEEIKKV